MINKKDLNRLKKIFKKYRLELAYLFGSQVRGQVGKLSDIDIAVLFNEKIFSRISLDSLLRLIHDLKTTLGNEKVDVAVLNNASPVLKHQAALCGQRIYVKNEKKAFEFEKSVLKEYEDTKFLRQTYYNYMKERIKNGTLGEFPRWKTG